MLSQLVRAGRAARSQSASALTGLRHLGDGLIVHATAAWAYFRVEPARYAFRSEEERDVLVDGVIAALTEALEVGEVHLLSVAEPYDAASWRAATDRLVADPAPQRAEFYDLIEARRVALSDGTAGGRMVLLGVRIDVDDPTVTAGLRRLAGAVERGAGVDGPLPRSELAGYQNRRDLLAAQLATSTLRARPASTAELAWAIRRHFCRALPTEMLDQPLTRSGPLQPAERALLAESTILNGATALEVGVGENRALVSTLAFASFPPQMTVPGHEWLLTVADLPFPVDISVRVRKPPVEEVLADASRTAAAAADQNRDAASRGQSADIEVGETEEAMAYIAREVGRGGVTVVYEDPRLIVAAADRRQLEQRIAAVKQAYQPLQIKLAAPAGSQLRLFHEATPGDRRRVTAYERRRPLITLAGSGITTGGRVGDPAGWHLGFDGAGPVTAALLRRALANDATVIGLTGAQGGGKTTFGQLLLHAGLLDGAVAVALDPKGDLKGVVALAQQMGLDADQITVSGSDAGRCDPCGLRGMVGTTEEDVRELVGDTLGDLLSRRQADKHDAEEAIAEAVADVFDTYAHPTCGLVIQQLESTSAAAPLGRLLRRQSQLAHARLLVDPATDGSVRPDYRLLARTRGLTVVQIEGLQLPDPDTPRDDWTVAQRHSAAAFRVMARYCRQIAALDPALPKLLFFDEFWMLNTTREGVSLVNWLSRMGRARNVGVIVATQTVGDLASEAMRNAITDKFSFRTRGRDEPRRVLDWHDLAPTGEHLAAVTGLGNQRRGACLYTDPHGRSTVLAVDPVADWVLELLSSTPPDAAATRHATPDQPAAPVDPLVKLAQ